MPAAPRVDIAITSPVKKRAKLDESPSDSDWSDVENEDDTFKRKIIIGTLFVQSINFYTFLARKRDQDQAESPLDQLNSTLKNVLKISPMKLKKLSSVQLIEEKSLQIGRRAVEMAVGKTFNPQKKLSACDSNIMKDIKIKFTEAAKYSEKIQLLTIAASAQLSVGQIAKEFNTTKYLAQVAIEQYQKFGVLSKPSPLKIERIPEAHIQTAKDYYLNDEISKMLPGRKDFVTLKLPNGVKIQEQKRLLLFNLRTVHGMFKDKYSDSDISIQWAKFAELRPPQVVFAGSPGTLVMCVCMYHTNPALMWEPVAKAAATFSNLTTCTDCILATLCNPPSPDCNLGNCPECPGSQQLEKTLKEIIATLDDIKITYSQWVVESGRCSLAVFDKHEDEFIESFMENLEKLKPHRFLVQMQHAYFEHLKDQLKEGEVLILGDYSENFSFVIQNAIQSNYWKNDQSTVHVFVCIYKGADSKLKYVHHVVISDYLKHETSAVHLFQTRLMKQLPSILPFKIKRVIYITDGAASQYKNRYNFCNLMHHEIDFGCPAEWSFHPTSHGKNLCDGVGGTVKRKAGKAYNASLQRGSTQQITTPKEFYDYVRINMPNIVFDYTDAKQHAQHNRKLARRFKNSPAIDGCRSMHYFKPKSTSVLAAKVYSLSFKEELYDLYNVK